MTLARLFKPNRLAARWGARKTPPPREVDDAARLDARVEPLIAQLEDDMRFTLRSIGHEADTAKTKIDESVEQVEHIRAASLALASLSASAEGVSEAMAVSAARLETATGAIRRDVAGADLFIGEARALAAEVSATMGRLAQSVGRIDTVMHTVATIARHTSILALNAGIEASRAGPEGCGFAAVADEVKGLADTAQTAASDIAAQIAALHAVADRNGVAVANIAALIGRIDPVVRSIQDSVAAQSRESAEFAARAAEGARFVEAVAKRAEDVRGLAEVANVASQQARVAGEGVAQAMRHYAQRATVYLRNSVSGNRRLSTRTPVKIPGFAVVDGLMTAVTALDISQEGALLSTPAAEPKIGARSRLILDGVGECPGAFVAADELGHHFTFESASEATRSRIGKVIAAVGEADAPTIAATEAAAARIAQAFEDGLAFGEIALGDLVTTDYRPIPGADPAQFETNALAFYERVLPPIFKSYWEGSPEPVFAFAIDRNAYVPVHHPRYAEPQRPGQKSWNHLHARNRRIAEHWRMLALARNLDPRHRQTMRRQMIDGSFTPVKAFAAPIRVGGKLWGNVLIGHFY